MQQEDPNDPSTFKKDDRLKQSFYGLAYSPNGVIYPECGAVLSDVITDIQLMSQLTKVSIRDPAPRFPTRKASRSQREVIFGSYEKGGIRPALLLGVYFCPDISRVIVAYSALRFGL